MLYIKYLVMNTPIYIRIGACIFFANASKRSMNWDWSSSMPYFNCYWDPAVPNSSCFNIISVVSIFSLRLHNIFSIHLKEIALRNIYLSSQILFWYLSLKRRIARRVWENHVYRVNDNAGLFAVYFEIISASVTYATCIKCLSSLKKH